MDSRPRIDRAPKNVVTTIMKRMALLGVLGLAALAATTGVASAAKLPRLYSHFTFRHNRAINFFQVRPSTIDLDSASGGELDLHWHSWTASGATATGTSHPDHGAFPVRVSASHPHDGLFLILLVKRLIEGRWRSERLILTQQIGPPPDLYGWLTLQSIDEPGSGVQIVGE
jgi:hypothetical protein